MSRMIHNKEVIARKDHDEMSSEWFSNDMSSLSEFGLTFSEYRAIAKLKANNWKIKKGQKCKVFVGIDCDGDIYRAYYLQEIDDIVRKYDLAEYVC